MVGTFFKRLGAYLVDLLIVYVFTLLIFLLPFFQTNQDQITEKLKELETVSEKLQNKEISEEEFEQAVIPIQYATSKLNTNYVILTLCIDILYFGLFQFFRKGQTIGKQIFKIRVVTKDGETVSMLNTLLRTIILNNTIISVFSIIILYTMNEQNYYPVYSNVNLVGSVLSYVSLFLILVREDGRGIHDFVGGTKVINDTISNTSAQTITDISVEEIKEEKLKKQNKKNNKKKQD